MSGFSDFNLTDELMGGLEAMGFQTPTEIQQEAIPPILKGQDVLGCAQTGTGKTGAFLLPVIDRIIRDKNRPNKVNTIIIAPTRELAIQIDQQIEGFAYFTGVTSIPIYGGGTGNSWDTQKKALKQGADIVVATPGRLIAHIQMGYVDFSQVQHCILDEADKMLDMGFHEDISTIFAEVPKTRQCLMFSATMPPKIRKFARELLTNPFEISIAISKPAEGVIQAAYLVHANQKLELLRRILTEKKEFKSSVIIFSSTKKMVREIHRMLSRQKFAAGWISSELEQSERVQVLNEFKARNLKALVATDVISRGIDIKDIDVVINFDVPRDAEDYVHRVGRTARAKSSGMALTLISGEEVRDFMNIERLIEQEIPKINLPEGMDKGPEYVPSKNGRGGRGRHSGKGRSGNRGGQKRYGKR